MTKKLTFTQSQVDSIAAALGHAADGLTHSEIEHLLRVAKLTDGGPGTNKVIRLQAAFVENQNRRGDRIHILAFIRFAMKPERYLGNEARYEVLRASLNRAIAFGGLSCDKTGALVAQEAVSTISAAEGRAKELRSDLVLRSVHSDVLSFCRAELLQDNYFHATLEAVKSVAAKIRDKTGLDDDGAVLCDQAFGGEIPRIAINTLSNKSERDEQKGFCNLVKGVFGMFRNTTAHEARIHWIMDKEDAEDLFSLLSLIHRRIDKGRIAPRV